MREKSMHNAKRAIHHLPAQLGLVIAAIDIVALCVATMCSHYLFPLFLHQGDYNSGAQALNYFVMFNGLLLVSLSYKGHYKKRIPYWQQVQTIVKILAVIVVVTVMCYAAFHIQISLPYMILNWGIAGIVLALGRLLAFRLLRLSKNWHLPVTLLGNNQMVIDCMYAFCNDGQTGYRVDTIMLRDRNKTPVCLDFIPKGHPPITHIDATGEYLDYIKNHRDNFYIIDLEGLRGENRDNLIRFLEMNDVSYAIVPSTKRLHLYGMDPLYFFGNDVMVLQSRTRHKEGLYFLIKRTMDIVVSLACLPILGVVTVIVYAAKKREKSDTPIFYGGKRVGLNGEEFSCWKFCTMRRDADEILHDLLASDPAKKAEWDKYQKLSDDPRIDSRISAILRKTSLDELPQLWNVFVGDMAIVGPRPILPFQREEYGETLPMYESVRPGITGLWQVSGRNETTFEQRAYWDSWYIKNWSPWHDIVIMFKTVSVIITKRGAG